MYVESIENVEDITLDELISRHKNELSVYEEIEASNEGIIGNFFKAIGKFIKGIIDWFKKLLGSSSGNGSRSDGPFDGKIENVVDDSTKFFQKTKKSGKVDKDEVRLVIPKISDENGRRVVRDTEQVYKIEAAKKVQGYSIEDKWIDRVFGNIVERNGFYVAYKDVSINGKVQMMGVLINKYERLVSGFTDIYENGGDNKKLKESLKEVPNIEYDGLINNDVPSRLIFVSLKPQQDRVKYWTRDENIRYGNQLRVNVKIERRYPYLVDDKYADFGKRYKNLQDMLSGSLNKLETIEKDINELMKKAEQKTNESNHTGYKLISWMLPLILEDITYLLSIIHGNKAYYDKIARIAQKYLIAKMVMYGGKSYEESKKIYEIAWSDGDLEKAIKEVSGVH